MSGFRHFTKLNTSLRNLTYALMLDCRRSTTPLHLFHRKLLQIPVEKVEEVGMIHNRVIFPDHLNFTSAFERLFLQMSAPC